MALGGAAGGRRGGGGGCGDRGDRDRGDRGRGRSGNRDGDGGGAGGDGDGGGVELGRLEDVGAAGGIRDGDGAERPVDDGVEALQPRHAEDGVVAGQGDGDEVDGEVVRGNTKGRGGEHAGGGGGTAVGEDDLGGLGLGDGGEAMLAHESIGDELGSRAAVDEDDGRVAVDGPAELEEAARGGSNLVDLVVRRACAARAEGRVKRRRGRRCPGRWCCRW